MIKKILIIGLSVTVIGTLLTSCVSVQHPQRSYYMMNIKMPRPQSKISDQIIEVNNPTIVPQFAGLSFVYRPNDISYMRDYYNLFFESPEQQIYQYITRYLNAAKVFKYVSTGLTTLKSDFILQPKILELYADYRDAKHPKARLAINFTLISDTDELLFNKTFYEALVLKHKDSQSLIQAWNAGLQRILYKLVITLREKASE